MVSLLRLDKRLNPPTISTFPMVVVTIVRILGRMMRGDGRAGHDVPVRLLKPSGRECPPHGSPPKVAFPSRKPTPLIIRLTVGAMAATRSIRLTTIVRRICLVSPANLHITCAQRKNR